jgi:hypothetical protein
MADRAAKMNAWMETTMTTRRGRSGLGGDDEHRGDDSDEKISR